MLFQRNKKNQKSLEKWNLLYENKFDEHSKRLKRRKKLTNILRNQNEKISSNIMPSRNDFSSFSM